MNAHNLILYFYVFLPAIVGAVVLYYVVKAAVRNGIKEARADLDKENML